MMVNALKGPVLTLNAPKASFRAFDNEGSPNP
jgi:hypothetical protein